MNNKELKRLSRRELVDIIYQLKRNEEKMEKEIEALKEELQDKRIRISTAGSLADAAMSISNVVSAAQMTADVYLNEITYMKEDTQKECSAMIEQAEKRAKEIISNAVEKVAKYEMGEGEIDD